MRRLDGVGANYAEPEQLSRGIETLKDGTYSDTGNAGFETSPDNLV